MAAAEQGAGCPDGSIIRDDVSNAACLQPFCWRSIHRSDRSQKTLASRPADGLESTLDGTGCGVASRSVFTSDRGRAMPQRALMSAAMLGRIAVVLFASLILTRLANPGMTEMSARFVCQREPPTLMRKVCRWLGVNP